MRDRRIVDQLAILGWCSPGAFDCWAQFYQVRKMLVAA